MDSMNEIDYKNLKAVSDTDRVSNHICRKTSIEDITAKIIHKLNPFIVPNISDEIT